MDDGWTDQDIALSVGRWWLKLNHGAGECNFPFDSGAKGGAVDMT